MDKGTERRTNLADELDFIPLNVLHCENIELGKKVQTQIVNSVAQNRLLDEKDIAFGFLDFLDHVEEIGTLFLEDLIHLAVVVHNDLILHL